MNLSKELFVLKASLTNARALEELVELDVLRVLENPYVREVVEFCVEYFSKNRTTPPSSVLLSEFEDKPHALQMIQRVVSDDDILSVSDQYVVEMVERERQKQALLLLSKEVIPKIGQDDVDVVELWERGRSLLQIRQKGDRGIVYQDDWPRSYISRYDELFKYHVPTGFSELDALLEGGVRRGWLAVVVGGSGLGKSTILQNISLVAALNGNNVLYVTLEMLDWEVEVRLDKMIYIAMHPEQFSPTQYVQDVEVLSNQDRIRGLVQNIPGKISIYYYPPHTLSPVRLSGLVEKVQPDVVVVDYGDLMKPVFRSGDRWWEIAEIFERLKGIAAEKDVILWTASQVSKTNMYKQQVSSSETYGSSEKVFNADLLLTINRTIEEASTGRMRLFVGKSRHTPMGQWVHLEIRGGLLMVPLRLTDEVIQNSFKKEETDSSLHEEIEKLMERRKSNE